ncbi:PIN domain-containing protein [Candidatus Woesearchaeota archaeon]|nr:PIN domain-containing protein [Candidatus Woesearchaeota archaeon]
MVKAAVFDTGPFIHVNEIGSLKILRVIKKIKITLQVAEELRELKNELNIYRHIEVKKLFPQSKDLARYLIEKFDLDLGEATSIALCKQEKISLFFTDDLEAREVAKVFGFEPHGTLAIILRALRERYISKKEASDLVKKIHRQSSLFITSDLIRWIQHEIEKYRG